uniref:Zinc finger ZPR1-type domain-containing protein n=1 Tax=Ciona savignyi TaxID=51511 RepID=H2Y6X1_CIOSA
MASDTTVKDDKSSMFEPISADNEDTGLTEVQSLCVNCEEQGTTKFLFIKIPFYKEIVISSFHCPNCLESNNEVQSAGSIQEKGVIITCKVKNRSDLNRQVVRADSATITIPELQFEIPPASQKGTLSTIEGILQRAIDGLKQEQPIRKSLHPDVFEKIEVFIAKLETLRTTDEEFTLVVDDPSGNSFVENPFAPKEDPAMSFSYYKRSIDQNKTLGLAADDAETEPEKPEIDLPTAGGGLDLKNEVVSFETTCSSCDKPNTTNMKVVKIPHFKEVIIMATNCDNCGKRSNEVKSGTGFEPKGRKITLKVTDPKDLTRDVLKSETCSVEIPELEMVTGGNAISGKFTTVEGLLEDLKTMMIETNPFISGDSVTNDKLSKFVERLGKCIKATVPFTLILDDPNSNSFIQNLYSPEPDPNLSQLDYERTYEQNEELGLNDMKTENYS